MTLITFPAIIATSERYLSAHISTKNEYETSLWDLAQSQLDSSKSPVAPVDEAAVLVEAPVDEAYQPSKYELARFLEIFRS